MMRTRSGIVRADPQICIFQMSDRREQLALSCNFAMQGATLVRVEDAGRITLDLTGKPELIVDKKYKVLSLIGEGGMGAVYKVHHVLLLKDMALKTFRSHNLSAEVWLRFQREAQAIAKLKHRNIVEVFDFGIADGKLPYYTMSLLSGESLAEKLEKVGHLEVADALRIFVQVAEALAHAHRQGIVHRDLKPANIFLEQTTSSKKTLPQPKIVDFGIAKLSEEGPVEESQTLTQVGTIFGSPLYMSPEQAQGGMVDHRSDIYSFGCTLFEALTGEPPFFADTAFATMLCHINNSPARLRDVIGADIPQRLDNLMEKLLAKNPADRYQSFSDVISDLDFCADALEKLKQEQLSQAKAQDSSYSKQNSQSDPNNKNSKEKKVVDRAALSRRRSLLAGGIALAAIVAFGIVAINQRLQTKVSPVPVKIPREELFDVRTPDTEAEDPYKEQRLKEVAKKEPFLVGQVGNYLVFRFPDYDSMGEFFPWPEWRQPMRWPQCKGRVDVPIHTALRFRAKEQFFRSPELFDRFGANDLRGISLEPGPSGVTGWGDDVLPRLQRFVNLDELDLNRNDAIDDKAIPSFEKMRQLKTLNISGTSIDGEALAKSKILMERLDVLYVRQLKKVPMFIRALARPDSKCHITSLFVDICGLDDSDLVSLSKIKSLRQLGVQSNKFDGTGLAALARSSNVEELFIDRNKIDAEVLERLPKFKRLKRIQINGLGISPEKREKIRRNLAPCAVVFM